MTDFALGDRVRMASADNLYDHLLPGMEGVVREANNLTEKGNLIKVEFDSLGTLAVWCHTLEKIGSKPTLRTRFEIMEDL